MGITSGWLRLKPLFLGVYGGTAESRAPIQGSPSCGRRPRHKRKVPRLRWPIRERIGRLRSGWQWWWRWQWWWCTRDASAL